MHAKGLSLREIDDNVRVNGSVIDADSRERCVHASQGARMIRAVGNDQDLDLHGIDCSLQPR